MNRDDDDLAIPSEIEARLRSVDDALPPMPAWHAPADEPSRLRVVRVRRASRGPSLAAVAIAVVALMAVFLLLGRVPTAPVGASPSPGASGAAASGATPSASTPGASSPGASSGPAVPAVEVLRGPTDGSDLIVQRVGWAGCELVGGDALIVVPDAAAIDAAADAQGVEAGWLDEVPAGSGNVRYRFWLGQDVVGLAMANGSRLVAIGGRGDVWLAGASRAGQWISIVTPKGRTAWLKTGSMMGATGTCASAAPPWLTETGLRSFSCLGGQPDQADCAAVIDAMRAQVPDALGADVDLVLAGTCPGWARCAAPIDGPHVMVVTRPAGWQSLADVRIFVVGPLGAALPIEVVGVTFPDQRLDVASRPSLPLPTSARPDPGAVVSCPSARVAGDLRGSPWDPRVAWVGTTAVRWPSGFSAAFVPDLVLIGPDHNVVAREGDAMVLGGGFVGADSAHEVFGACDVNGTPYLRP